MQSVSKIALAVIAVLAAGSISAYLIAGLPLLLIFLLALADRMLKTSSFGFDLIALSVILMGMIYGAFPAFVFGAFFSPVVTAIKMAGGIPHYERLSFFEELVFDVLKGVTGIVAAFLIAYLQPLLVVIAAMLFKNAAYAATDRLFGYPFRISYLINIPTAMLVFLSLQKFLF